MLNLFRQIAAVMTTSIYTLKRRLGTSLVIVIGVTAVVGMLATVLAMAIAMTRSVGNTGRDDRAMVLRAGSSTETTSMLLRDEVLSILTVQGIATDAAGKPLYSAELLSQAGVMRRNIGGASTAVTAALRGVSPDVLAVRPEMKLVQGRLFEPGKYELIVGETAARRFEGLEIGKTLKLRNSDWQIVGVFSSGGDTHESELMADRDTLAGLLRWNHYNSVLVKLQSAEALSAFETSLRANPGLNVDVLRESDYFRQQSKDIGKVVFVAAYVLAGIMAFGAIFAALNTMYASIVVRAREIAILRALGYGGELIVFSVVVESLILTMLGSAIGLALAWYFVDGKALGTGYGGLNTQLMFDLQITPQVAFVGIAVAVVIGLVGSFFPAMAAARVPVTAALRDI
jgi:putative ABC transport system permease protein